MEEGSPEPEVAEDRGRDRLVHRDNTFGTSEEDAFRRDFTINALFYDIGTFSIIDYTGGLQDLQQRVVRCIGDPGERFREDPVRMLRAVAMAARLGFTIDKPIESAFEEHRHELARSAAPRLMEELYKLLRSGASENAFRMLAERRLLEPISPELQAHASASLWTSLRELDAYRSRFEGVPEQLTNPLLLGSLLSPLGQASRTIFPVVAQNDDGRKEPRLSLGLLPLPRRDLERLRQILSLQRRLVDTTLSPRARRGLIHRAPFRDALTWLDIHGGAPEVVEHWRGFIEAVPGVPDGTDTDAAPPRRRRRRRRRLPPAVYLRVMEVNAEC